MAFKIYYCREDPQIIWLFTAVCDFIFLEKYGKKIKTCVFVALSSADSSPGPRYHVGASVTRFGQIKTPSYSILGRTGRSGSKGDLYMYTSIYIHIYLYIFKLFFRTRHFGVVDADTEFHRFSYLWVNTIGQTCSCIFSGELFQTPGPGAYSPEKAPPLNNHVRAPSYSMGSRTRYRSSDAVPAPNRFLLHLSPVLRVFWTLLALTIFLLALFLC